MPSRFDRTPISTVATSDGDNLKSKTAPAADTGAVTVMSEGGSAESGQVQFSALVAQGALTKNTAGGSPTFVAAGGFERDWDACSSTVRFTLSLRLTQATDRFLVQPFLRSGATEQIITYDDPESLGMKAAFARQAGILGVNMWDAHGDTQQWDLIDGVRRGLGIE
jgi:chitinase